MSLTATCPDCGAQLALTNHGSFDSWVCPAGHGLGATLSEAYEVAQEDELRLLWQLARTATSSSGRSCPMCERPMVSVRAPHDADEALEGEPADGPATGEVPVEVCTADQVIWFDTGELDALPADLPDAEPTPEQEAALADIRRAFGDALLAAGEADEGFTDRTADRLLASSRVARMLVRS